MTFKNNTFNKNIADIGPAIRFTGSVKNEKNIK